MDYEKERLEIQEANDKLMDAARDAKQSCDHLLTHLRIIDLEVKVAFLELRLKVNEVIHDQS